MGCCVNGTLEHKEEERHTNTSTIMVRDTPQSRTIGGGHPEDKEEVDDRNTIQPTPHHP